MACKQIGAPPTVWTIAGSDPSSGGGVQADLKTFNTLKVHGCSIITCLTAQNEAQVSAIEPVSTSILKSQFTSLAEMPSPKAVKIGLVGFADQIEIIAHFLKQLQTYVILDPVLCSSSGKTFLNEQGITLLKKHLFPLCDLITPNLAEAETLTGNKMNSSQEVERAGQDLLALGCRSVLIKGGHASSSYAQDFWTHGDYKLWMTSYKQDHAKARGTGCTLSSAIAAGIALELGEVDALVFAKSYFNQALRNRYGLGKEIAFLSYPPWPGEAGDLPWVTDAAEPAKERPNFPSFAPSELGFYPIVDRLEWLKRLLPLGVSTIQLRIKDLKGKDLELEIRDSIQYAKKFNCNLFINDYWKTALKYEAYGVHLGQEDLKKADLPLLLESEVRLGVSTHCYEEMARALAVGPSYIAIGPIFPTKAKEMKYKPQGIEGFKLWRKLLNLPLVAIGGITLERAEELKEAGADGIAVISDIQRFENIEQRVKCWLDLFQNKDFETT